MSSPNQPPQPEQQPVPPQPYQPQNPQPPYQPHSYNPITQPAPQQPYGQQPYQPVQAPAPKKKRTGLVILAGTGVLVLLFGIIGALSKPATTTPAAPAPSITASAVATTEPTTEPTEEATTEPTEEPTEEATTEPEDTSFKYGQTIEFTVDDIPASLRLDAPKTAANMFAKKDIEVKAKFCNLGDEAIEDLSASSLGLYAEDADGGSYDLYGVYRTPEFPIYSVDGKKVRAGKCVSGWIGFSGANHRKGLRLAIDIADSQYTWNKSGK